MKFLAAFLLLVPSLVLAQSEVTYHDVTYRGVVVGDLIVDSEGNMYAYEQTVDVKSVLTLEEAQAAYDKSFQLNLNRPSEYDTEYAYSGNRKDGWDEIIERLKKLKGNFDDDGGLDDLERQVMKNRPHIKKETYATLSLQYGDRVHARVSRYNKTPGVSMLVSCGRLKFDYGPGLRSMRESEPWCMAGVGYYRKLNFR